MGQDNKSNSNRLAASERLAKFEGRPMADMTMDELRLVHRDGRLAGLDARSDEALAEIRRRTAEALEKMRVERLHAADLVIVNQHNPGLGLTKWTHDVADLAAEIRFNVSERAKRARQERDPVVKTGDKKTKPRAGKTARDGGAAKSAARKNNRRAKSAAERNAARGGSGGGSPRKGGK